MKSIQRALALVLVYVLVGLMLPVPAAAAEAPLVNPKLLAGLVPPTAASMPNQAQAQKAPADKVWTHGGKIMTVIGLACIGAGAVMMTRENTTIGDTGTQINWRATGAVWMGAGGVLTILGLTRRR